MSSGSIFRVGFTLNQLMRSVISYEPGLADKILVILITVIMSPQKLPSSLARWRAIQRRFQYRLFKQYSSNTDRACLYFQFCMAEESYPHLSKY